MTTEAAIHWRECVVCGWYVNEKDEHVGTPPGKWHTPDPREIAAHREGE